jgi:SAM-dependent methyltransferase
MNTSDIDQLIDPVSGLSLIQIDARLISNDGKEYPIINGIPRFVDESHYSSDFGIQWNKFPTTQLDSKNGKALSRDRLARCLNGHIDELCGKRVLEAGSGSGRFTEILAGKGAFLHTFDSSLAIEANFKNNNFFQNIVFAQADISNCPFMKNSYDFVICLGVVQHTPDPEKTITTLYELVKPGGYLIFDHYLFKWRNILPPPIGIASNIYRPIILKLPQKQRMNAVKKIVDFWFPFHWKFRNYQFAQRILRRISPVLFYWGNLDLGSKEQFYEFALLDTHDSLTDKFKHHRTKSQLSKTLDILGALDIKVSHAGNGLEVFCQRPISD